jgi:hypothetical protein
VSRPSPFPPPDSPARRPPLARETAVRAGLEPERPIVIIVAEAVRLVACLFAAGAVVCAGVMWMAR